MPGVTIALVDTVIPDAPSGTLRAAQLDWLDALAADATDPVVVMGHHQQAAVVAPRSAIVAYTAGHTHRHRVRSMANGAPSIEVGCVKGSPARGASRVESRERAPASERSGAPPRVTPLVRFIHE